MTQSQLRTWLSYIVSAPFYLENSTRSRAEFRSGQLVLMAGPKKGNLSDRRLRSLQNIAGTVEPSKSDLESQRWGNLQYDLYSKGTFEKKQKKWLDHKVRNVVFLEATAFTLRKKDSRFLRSFVLACRPSPPGNLQGILQAPPAGGVTSEQMPWESECWRLLKCEVYPTWRIIPLRNWLIYIYIYIYLYIYIYIYTTGVGK